MPSSPPAGLRARIERGERLLGALALDLHRVPDPSASLDLLVVPAHLTAAAVRDAGLPVLALVTDDGQVAAALAEGAVEVVRRMPDGSARLLTGNGRAGVLVGSVAAARAAYTGGASLVVYDLTAVYAGRDAELADARPQASLTARPPLVLLSGMLGAASLWDAVCEPLGDLVLPWPIRTDLDDSIAELADSVLAAAPPTFLLGGHSLGGIIALEVLRRAPERVRALLLVSSSGRAPTAAQHDAWRSSCERVDTGGFEALATELALATVAPGRRTETALMAANLQMGRAVGPEGLRRQLTAQGTRTAALQVLREVDLPVLCVAGELDQVCPPALQEELAEHAVRGRLVTLDGCGHTAPLEDPRALADVVWQWLEDDVGLGR